MNDFYKRKNPHRLFRDKENAMLAGVCAGIADYFGFNRKGTRVVVALLFLFPPFIPVRDNFLHHPGDCFACETA